MVVDRFLRYNFGGEFSQENSPPKLSKAQLSAQQPKYQLPKLNGHFSTIDNFHSRCLSTVVNF